MGKAPKRLVLVVVLVLIAAGFLFLQQNDRQASMGDQSRPQRLEEKTAIANGVTIAARPELLGDGNLQFQIQLTAHSGDLSGYNAEGNVRLRSGGEEMVPLRAGNTPGSGPSGHHRELTVVFSRPTSDSFTLALRQLEGTEDAILQWP